MALAERMISSETTLDDDLDNHRVDHNSIDAEISALYEIKDIRNELNLLRRFLETQAEVVDQFSQMFWPGLDDECRERAQRTPKDHRDGFKQDCGLHSLIERINKMDGDAGRIQDGLQYLVELKESQGSLSEAQYARSLNNFIMLFTVVTIVFTPLSFMTSLFAVPIDAFTFNNQGNLFFGWQWIKSRMVIGEVTF
ncbi:hypothetical protein NA57DRAFT_69990 [Rhizodiscina lignyota]|uniref:Uncharacterized protein n=1 Tax=Rhizodiscina lignyota TaxID=1504668 RepID=A0A9P4MAK6_9PEZI|nr:hypothetical protein NA57DRAFT_69990 [Rhizodiscina lignyota]